MACPNCDAERVEWDNDYGVWCLRNHPGANFHINECPYCGEQLLIPSEACVRGCD